MSCCLVLSFGLVVPCELTDADVLDRLCFVLEEMLLLEPALKSKRLRAEQGVELIYYATCPTWLGRRKLRRELIKQTPGPVESFVLEKMASLVAELSRCLLGCSSLQVTNECVRRFDGTFTPICLKIVVSREADRVVLRMKKSATLEVNNLFHFLDQFLQSHFQQVAPSFHENGEPMEF